MHYSDLSNPYEDDNWPCRHGEPVCQPCSKCEQEDVEAEEADAEWVALQDVQELVIGR